MGSVNWTPFGVWETKNLIASHGVSRHYDKDRDRVEIRSKR